jgi:hypothetical protein
MAQQFNFIDSGNHFTIQSIVNNSIASDRQYPKNSLTTSIFGNTLYITTVNNLRLVDYKYYEDSCNLLSSDIANLQNQLDTIFASVSGGGGSVDISSLNKEYTQTQINANILEVDSHIKQVNSNVKHKKYRIEGSANYNIAISYLEIEPSVYVIDGYTITGTTDLGFETLTAIITYNSNKLIINIQYT